MSHLISQAESSLFLAFLNAVSTSARVVLICAWDLKDLIAKRNCSSILLPENQKEYSARRVTTDRIVSYIYICDKGIHNTGKCLNF